MPPQERKVTDEDRERAALLSDLGALLAPDRFDELVYDMQPMAYSDREPSVSRRELRKYGRESLGEVTMQFASSSLVISDLLDVTWNQQFEGPAMVRVTARPDFSDRDRPRYTILEKFADGSKVWHKLRSVRARGILREFKVDLEEAYERVENYWRHKPEPGTSSFRPPQK